MTPSNVHPIRTRQSQSPTVVDVLTAERLREVLDYSPTSGRFVWKVQLNARGKVGTAAGTKANGYTRISIDKKIYAAHRLVWLYVHGRWPQGEIDHINGIRNDNRVANLREVSSGENSQNQRHPSSKSKSGYLGVSPSRGRWLAQIRVNRKTRNLGRYDTREEAHAVYLAAKREAHPFWGGTEVQCLLRDFDTLLADLALDNPDLEPGYHAAIREVRNQYKTLRAYEAGHPSAHRGPDDGGPAA